MFSALKQRDPIHILEKGEYPNYKIGYIESVTQPRPKYSTYTPNPFQDTVMDINVMVGDERMEFKQVPSTAVVTESGNMIISETKMDLANKVSDMLQNSRSILDSQQYHQHVADACEDILKQLNPSFAREKERDEAIENLNIRVDGLQSGLDKILGILTKAETQK